MPKKEKVKRLLSQPPAFYNNAQHWINSVLFSEIDTIIDMEVFWCRYIQNKVDPSFIPHIGKMHSHSFFELNCVMSGKYLFVNSTGEEETASTSDYLIVAPHVYHASIVAQEDSELFSIAFEPHCQDDEMGNIFRQSFELMTLEKGKLSPFAVQTIEMILYEASNHAPFCLQLIKSLFVALVIEITRPFLLPRAKSTNYNFRASFMSDKRLQMMERHLSDNMKETVSIEELAQHLNITPRYLGKLVRNAYGISTKQYTDQIKSNYARNLLLETDLPISKIAEQCGFYEESNFIRFFKRMEGLSPGCFRKSKNGR